jgi:hypothetical protein
MLTGGSSLILDRWINKLPFSRKWFYLAVGLLLFLLPVGIAYLEGIVDLIFVSGIWRNLFIQPVLIPYVLILSQPLQHTREGVAQALRPIVQIDDQGFRNLVKRSCGVNVIGELVGFVMGASFILLINRGFEVHQDAYWSSLYSYLTGVLMWGMIGWITYGAFSLSRLNRELLRQPLEFDLFDPKPFEPIGRQSLTLSMVYIGGITLSLFFTIDPNSSFQISTWVIYGSLLLVTVLVFFLNMLHTNRVLTGAKKQMLEGVERGMAKALYRFQELPSGGEGTHLIAAEINAWAIFKKEVKETRVWPFNTEILHSLLVSILTPILLSIARLFAIWFPIRIKLP